MECDDECGFSFCEEVTFNGSPCDPN
jgi:hypothetical protein